MRADKLVRLPLQLAPQGFFALIGRNPNDAFRCEFKSVELKETSLRIDGAFIPKDPNDEVYFVELKGSERRRWRWRRFCADWARPMSKSRRNWVFRFTTRKAFRESQKANAVAQAWQVRV